MGGSAKPDEITGKTTFLAPDDSDKMTGQDVTFEAGMVAVRMGSQVAQAGPGRRPAAPEGADVPA